MAYQLQFLPSALKEWNKLGATVKEQFRKKLAERLAGPHVPGDALHGLPNHYKIKLRAIGYRLVYRVEDSAVVVTVVAVGKREGGDVYRTAKLRR